MDFFSLLCEQTSNFQACLLLQGSLQSLSAFWGLVARSTSPLGVVGLPGILGRGRGLSVVSATFSTTPRRQLKPGKWKVKGGLPFVMKRVLLFLLLFKNIRQ